MAPRPVILQSAHDLFPASANRTVMVENAWRPYDGHTEPGPGSWNEGWSRIGLPATRTLVENLKAQGFTHVNVAAGVRHRADVRISRLI